MFYWHFTSGLMVCFSRTLLSAVSSSEEFLNSWPCIPSCHIGNTGFHSGIGAQSGKRAPNSPDTLFTTLFHLWKGFGSFKLLSPWVACQQNNDGGISVQSFSEPWHSTERNWRTLALRFFCCCFNYTDVFCLENAVQCPVPWFVFL